MIGLLSCGFGVYWLWTSLSFWRRAERVSAVVTDVHAGREMRVGGVNLGVRRRDISFPVVKFTTHEGRDVETTANTGAHPMSARFGDETTVLYDPADPTVADVTTGYRLSLGLTFLVFGLVAVLLSIRGPGLLNSSVSSRLIIMCVFGLAGYSFTLSGGTTLWMALRVKRTGYSILGGLFLGIGLLLWSVLGFILILFAFGV